MGNSINHDPWFVTLAMGHMANETNSYFLWINHLILCKTFAFLHNFKFAYIQVIQRDGKKFMSMYLCQRHFLAFRDMNQNIKTQLIWKDTLMKKWTDKKYNFSCLKYMREKPNKDSTITAII